MFIERMAGQDYIDKAREYLDYLEEHLENVRKAFSELSLACDGMQWVGDDYAWHILREEVVWHDVSKLSQAELVPYTDKFYPTKHKPMEWHNDGFDKAWDHHKKHNRHHHESAKTYADIVHMVIDWTAIGYKFGDTAREYYERNRANIRLSDDHVNFLHELFDKLEKYRQAKRLITHQ